jgi:hypothetical protein
MAIVSRNGDSTHKVPEQLRPVVTGLIEHERETYHAALSDAMKQMDKLYESAFIDTPAMPTITLRPLVHSMEGHRRERHIIALVSVKVRFSGSARLD